METTLSMRLSQVAQFVPQGATLLDVGSDHAYLPIALVQAGSISRAIAGEVVKGPYESALANVADAQLTDKIAVRLANGLEAFTPADGVSAITICGMGGRLIAEILEAGKEKLDQVERLILQPNNREDDLRRWLMTNGYQIVAETILSENDKIYEIMVAEHGQETLSDKELRFGKWLQQERTPVFVTKWQREVEKLSGALAQIPETNQDDRSAMSQKIEMIQEVLGHEGK